MLNAHTHTHTHSIKKGQYRSMIKNEYWADKVEYVVITPPQEFSFQECLVYLGRSNNECLHSLDGDTLHKLIKIGEEPILLKISQNNKDLQRQKTGRTATDSKNIRIEFPVHQPDQDQRAYATNYVWDLLDLARDLTPFYELANQDTLLANLTAKYYGLRIVGIPDLFEALTWAVIGQQINLTFAYTLKRRFVEHFGEQATWAGHTYWLYPRPETISQLDASALTSLQFTRGKADYVIGIAKLMAAGTLSQNQLQDTEDYELIRKALLSVRGVGSWTADYVLMKCFRYPSAFPIADVGLHNALKNQLALDRKPSIDEIVAISAGWSGWEAYATFYLWRSLND